MNKKLKKWLIAGGCAVVAAAALGAAAGAAGNYLGKADDYVKTTKEQNYTYLSKQALKGQTVLIGDSITEYYNSGDLFVPYTKRTGTLVYNRGISGEVSGRTLGRFYDNALITQPKNLVLLIGINDLGQKAEPETIVKNVRGMLDMAAEKSPDTHVILQAVYPVNEHMPQLAARMMVGGRKNSDVLLLNRQLKALAQEKKITFLDLTDVLSDENGDFRREYCYDGLHPNAKGYAVITERLEPLLK